MSKSAFARGGRERPLIYGHRGTRRGAPENTLRAMRRALEQGADGIELDVRLCGSGEVVVVHDPDLQRVARASGVVAQLPWAALQGYDLGGGERVPTLDAAMDLVLGTGRLLNIELKSDVPDVEALVSAVVERVTARAGDQRERLMFSSFSPQLCARLLDVLPGAVVGFLFDRSDMIAPPGVAAMHPSHHLADAAALAGWRAAGYAVNVWTVNDAARAGVLGRAGVDGIITDDVPLVLGALDR